MLYKIFTLNTKIKTTIITICALSYNLTAQASRHTDLVIELIRL